MSVFNAMIISLKAYVITILVYFLLFAVVGNMQAKAASSEKSNIFEEVVISVAVTDNDNTGLSKALVDYLKETQNVVDPKTDDLRTMNDNVRFSIYDYALIIPQGFEDKIFISMCRIKFPDREFEFDRSKLDEVSFCYSGGPPST